MNNLIDFLKNQYVDKVYFCAGARNQSLLSVLEENFKIEFCVDERMASFMALGEAKISKKPIVVCTTSGTAVSECLSACVEAFYSFEKIIFLTADRPKRLQECFAPQTINQKEILKTFCRSYYTGSLGNISFDNIAYPIHLNIEIDHLAKDYLPIVRELDKNEFLKMMSYAQRPLAVFTEGANEENISLLDSKNVLIYIEKTARISDENVKNLVSYEKQLLELFKSNKIDVILKFGKTPITKLWRILDRELEKPEVIGMDEYPLGLPRGYKFLEKFSLPKTFEPQHLKQVNLLKLINDYPQSEPSMFYKILAKISLEDILFVGNSMPIRYIDLLRPKHEYVYASRGANGIDGQLATALGIAKRTSKNVHCLVGDLTFFYDISSCFIEWPKNLFVHIMNNGGGRIFERIEVNEKIVLSHEHKLKGLIAKGANKDQIEEHFPSNTETNAFWKAWSED